MLASMRQHFCQIPSYQSQASGLAFRFRTIGFSVAAASAETQGHMQPYPLLAGRTDLSTSRNGKVFCSNPTSWQNRLFLGQLVSLFGRDLYACPGTVTLLGWLLVDSTETRGVSISFNQNQSCSEARPAPARELVPVCFI